MKVPLHNPSLFALVMFLFFSGLTAQTFQIGHTTVVAVDESRNNRNIPLEIYYPSDVAGENSAIAQSGGQFPVLVFGHGFLMTWDAYQNIWNSLVPQGFIMVFPKTEGGFAPSHSAFGLDIAFAISYMNAIGNDTTGSIFNGRISDLNAVMGHSMGGGAAMLAGVNPEIKAIAVLAAAETNPSAINAAGQFSIPALVIAGENDCVTPPVSNQLAMYNALGSECKTYVGIIGGSHCQMADPNTFCTIGEATCTPAPAISRAEQHTVIDTYLISWLKATLKGDCSAGAEFNAQISSDSAISFLKNCSQCEELNLANNKIESFAVNPNPFLTHIEISNPDTILAELELIDFQGRVVATQKFSSALETIDASKLSSGVYFFRIRADGEILSDGKLIKQ